MDRKKKSSWQQPAAVIYGEGGVQMDPAMIESYRARGISVPDSMPVAPPVAPDSGNMAPVPSAQALPQVPINVDVPMPVKQRVRRSVWLDSQQIPEAINAPILDPEKVRKFKPFGN